MADPRHRLQDALAGRYRIERELGRGGMATVFLAEDLRHHRRVAIKVLDPEIGGAIGPERFVREIETVARLTHPHILPLYDSGGSGELLFFVMPFVEGESLRARLEREGPLPVPEALRIAYEVSEALEFAHTHGIVHRDVKPENVLLESGHAVVADFGLARALGAAGSHRLTTVGVTVGTPAYMSPEQATAAPNLDGRSDQYSLACLLFEMLAGQPPFTGPSAQSLMHQHVNVPPRPVTDLRPGAPAAVRDAIARALSKSPADRFTSVAEFAAALAATAPGPISGADLAPTVALDAAGVSARGPGAGGTSRLAPMRRRWMALVAVVLAIVVAGLVVWPRWLPHRAPAPVRKDWILVAAFDGPADDSSLAASSRELLCAALDQSRIVATVPRDVMAKALVASGRPPNTRVDPDLARELAYRSSVRAVLEGRIGRIGAGYSIVLRLVDTDSARAIITASGTAKSSDGLIPALGDLAKQLRGRLGENRGALAATRPMALVTTPSLEAYKLYLRGIRSALTGANVQAKANFRAALALDPDFAAAWAALSIPYANLGYPDSVILVCDEALRRPDRLTDEQRTHIRVSRQIADGDGEGAIANIDRAIMENPDALWPLTEGNDLLWQLGRFEDALDRVQRRERLRPFGPTEGGYLNEAASLMYLGRYDDARRVVARMSGVWKPWLAADIELRAGKGAAAESIVIAMQHDPRQSLENLGGSDLLLFYVRRARGALTSAESCYARFRERTSAPGYAWNDARAIDRTHFMFSALCERRPPPLARESSADTTATALVNRGLQAAFLGQPELARRCLERARTRPRREQWGELGPETLLEALIDGGEGRWSAAAALLQPIAIQRTAVGSVREDLSWVRWTLADAYEHLGQPDSAAAHLERITRDPLARTFRPYARLRLVPLCVRLGRSRDALRHWTLAMRELDQPDSLLMPRIERARAALAGTL